MLAIGAKGDGRRPADRNGRSVGFRRVARHTAARYLATGVLNTLVGLGVIYGAMYFLGMGNAAANALGYSVG